MEDITQIIFDEIIPPTSLVGVSKGWTEYANKRIIEYLMSPIKPEELDVSNIIFCLIISDDNDNNKSLAIFMTTNNNVTCLISYYNDIVSDSNIALKNTNKNPIHNAMDYIHYSHMNNITVSDILIDDIDNSININNSVGGINAIDTINTKAIDYSNILFFPIKDIANIKKDLIKCIFTDRVNLLGVSIKYIEEVILLYSTMISTLTTFVHT